MRPPPVFALIVCAAACARPVNRPATGPLPVRMPEANGPAVFQSGGPDGESPAPSTPILASTASVPVGMKEAERARAMSRLRDRHLLIPVAGVGPEHMQDTFTDARDGDRQHNAIDILAPRNTPILAADDGVVLRMSSNALGGITVFAADVDRQFVYYYAHLDHYDPDIYAGRKLTKGDRIGYVGTTGNAPKNVPHLHFQIMRWPDDGKYWMGDPINPYPLLHVLKDR